MWRSSVPSWQYRRLAPTVRLLGTYVDETGVRVRGDPKRPLRMVGLALQAEQVDCSGLLPSGCRLPRSREKDGKSRGGVMGSACLLMVGSERKVGAVGTAAAGEGWLALHGGHGSLVRVDGPR